MNTEDRTAKARHRTGVIDLIAQDPKTGEVVLVMDECEEWDGSDVHDQLAFQDIKLEVIVENDPPSQKATA